MENRNNTFDDVKDEDLQEEAFDPEAEDDETLAEEILTQSDENLTEGVDKKGPIGDAYRTYCHEIASYPRVTAEEELSLSKRIESGQIALALLQKTTTHDPVAAEDMEDLTLQDKDRNIDDRKQEFVGKTKKELEAILADGKEARDTLTQANLRLVISVAKKYDRRNGKLTIMDLIQEGNIGLMHAVEKFDYRKGNRFSTYAIWWIRQSIRRAIEEQSRTIRIPGHIVEVINRMRRTEKDLTQKLGHTPTDEEIAREMSVPEVRISELRQMLSDTTSLNAPTNKEDEEDGELGDFVADPTQSPSSGILQEGLKTDLNKAVDNLPERERYVVRERYGLTGKPPRTLDDIGKDLGVTKERVRQIEVHALRRILKSKDGEKLRGYLEE